MENDINRSKVNGPSKEDGSSDDGVACTSLNGLSNPHKRHEQSESTMGDDITLHHRIVEAWKEKLLRSCPNDERIRASAPRLAESLAKIVFTNSNAFDEHTSSQHMNERLRSLVQALKDRKNKKSESCCTKREGFLRKILGPEKHVRVRRLAEQIKLARLQKVGEGCAQCRVLESGAMVCPLPDGPSKTFPRPVQRLFFKVDLMNALEFRSIQAWQETNWDGLMDEAEEILREYHDWRNLKQMSSQAA